jgi:O-antigen ligase
MRLFTLFIFLAVTTFLIPVESALYFTIISLSIVFLSILHLITNKRKLNIKSYSKLNLFIYLMSISVLISFCINYYETSIDQSLNSDFLKLSILALSTCFLYFSTYFIINTLNITDKQKINFLFYIVLAGGVNAIITLFYWFSTTGGVFDRYNYTPPISGSNGIQLYYMVFAVLSAISLYKFRKSFSSFKRKIIYLCTFFCFLNMTTIMVREVWVIFIFTLFIRWFISSKKSYFYKRVIAVLIFFLISFIIYNVLDQLNILSDIFSENSEDSNSTLIRLALIEDSLKLFFSNPYFGVGYGTFSLNTDLVVQLSGGGVKVVNSPHNGLILIAAELGIFGLISVFFICYSILKDLRKTMINSDSNISKSISTMIFSLFLLLSLDQLITNSFILPPPTERSAVQLSFLLWLFISVSLANSNNNIEHAEPR